MNIHSIKGRNGSVLPVYGISQDPDTKDYIMVLQDEYCEKCGEEYTNAVYKWCKLYMLSKLSETMAESESPKPCPKLWPKLEILAETIIMVRNGNSGQIIVPARIMK